MLDLFHTVYCRAAGDGDVRPASSPRRWGRRRGRVVSDDGWIRLIVMLDRSGKAAVIEEAFAGASIGSLILYKNSSFCVLYASLPQLEFGFCGSRL